MTTEPEQWPSKQKPASSSAADLTRTPIWVSRFFGPTLKPFFVGVLMAGLLHAGFHLHESWSRNHPGSSDQAEQPNDLAHNMAAIAEKDRIEWETQAASSEYYKTLDLVNAQ